MIKKWIAVAAVVFVLTLSACNALPPLEEDSAAGDSRPVLSSDESREMISSEENGRVYPPDEPPVEAAAQLPVPDFLDKELQLLYRRAYMAYLCFDVGTDNINSNYPPVDGSSLDLPEEEMWGKEIGGVTYFRATGRYQTWVDFETLMLSLFTPEYYAELNAFPLFTKDENGVLYHTGGARGTNMLAADVPVEFELVEQTGERIEFNVIGHYYEYDGEEDWDGVVADGWDYTQKFPIILVKTGEGWRFSLFNTTK